MMRKTTSLFPIVRNFFLLALLAGVGPSCKENPSALLPYTEKTRMSAINVQNDTYVPKIAWTGGYVSVVGVNIGGRASLDSTLVWLIHTQGNNIHFPLLYGSLPAGAEDLTTQFGGHRLDTLLEDSNYTFWVLKEDAWAQMQNHVRMPILADTAGKFVDTSTSLVVNYHDTLYVNPVSATVEKKRIDLYINIRNVQVYGRLVVDTVAFKPHMTITPTNVDNSPIVKFQIVETGVKDTAVAACGVTESNVYDLNNIVWEVLTVDTIAGVVQYAKSNIIPSPIKIGQAFPRTRVFTPYPAGGLQRNKIYTFWLATSQWNKIDHDRSRLFHSYMSFETW